MGISMRRLTIALVLTCSFEVTLAAAGELPASAAPDVAEMLQRRQQSQLREQLVKEGRWDEVRRMDEVQLRRQQDLKKQTITRLNAELAHEGVVDTPTNGDGVFTICGPQRSPAKISSEPNGADTSFVR